MSDQSSAYCYPNYYGWDFDSSTGVNTFIERELTEEKESVKKQAGITTNKVRIAVEDGKVVISAE